MVKPHRGFRAEDLVQGKVGDCWFLSALAVVAERDDLIGRLIDMSDMDNNYGVIEVKLFVDGYWKTVVIDDFLPCLIDNQSEKEEEDNIQMALRQSLVSAGIDPKGQQCNSSNNNKQQRTSSKFDPYAIGDKSRQTLEEIQEFLHHDRFSRDPSYRANPHSSFVSQCSHPLQRHASTSDLAYSKARNNQLWVPFIEKVSLALYSASHDTYISNGFSCLLDMQGLC